VSPHDHSRWSIYELCADHGDFLPALHLAVTGRPQSLPYIEQEVQDLLESAAAGHFQVRPVIGAYEGDRLRLAVVGVESQGSSNLLLLPFELDSSCEIEGATLALRQALEIARSDGVTLCQLIGPECPSRWDIPLREAGMHRLTDLLYLTRRVPRVETTSIARLAATHHEWLTYSTETKSFFCEAIEQSYVQSLDCPELTDMRSPQQMLMAHRAAGPFDPAAWFVFMTANNPLGILLLRRARREPAMEIVYMGVAQVARGSGVADALMMKAMQSARQAGAETLILAVDSRNEPAKRFYQRWNFQEVMRRTAWITKLYAAGS